MIIYHSREALTARLAAWLHLKRLTGRVDLAEAWAAIGEGQGYEAAGLWAAGVDSDGHKVCAAGRASRPDVAERLLHGMAELFAIEPASYLLVDVGPVQAWRDLPVILLRRLGLLRLADAGAIWLLGRRRRECQATVQKALGRVAGRSRCLP